MAAKVWTDATITFFLADGTPGGSNWDLVAEPAWIFAGSMNGNTGAIVYTSPAGTQIVFTVGGLLDDDLTVPPVITMTNIRIQFTYSITCTGNTTISDGNNVVPVAGGGSGSFDGNNDPTVYWGGTDRATLFGSPALWQFTTTSVSLSQAIIVADFTVTVTYTAPSVISITPSSGSVSGGQAVTIRGGGFTAATGVTFGGTAATAVVIVDDETMTAVTPAHLSGIIDVEVLSVAIGTGLYTYVLDTIRLPPMPTRTPIQQGGSKRGR